jgi:hypothetical protein
VLVETPWLGGEYESALTNVAKKLVYVLIPWLGRSSHRVAVAHDGSQSSSGEPLLVGEGVDYAISLTVEMSDAAL